MKCSRQAKQKQRKRKARKKITKEFRKNITKEFNKLFYSVFLQIKHFLHFRLIGVSPSNNTQQTVQIKFLQSDSKTKQDFSVKKHKVYLSVIKSITLSC